MSENNSPYSGDGETVYATSPKQGETERDRSAWPDHTDPEWLKLQYHHFGRSQPEMAEIAGVSSSAIGYQMNKHDLETRSNAEAVSKAQGGHGKLFDEKWLRERYESGSTTTEMADELGVTHSAIVDAFNRFGIETRSRSEAARLARDRKFRDEKYRDAKWLYIQYWRLLKSAGEIANENGWAKRTVFRWLDQHDIATRSPKAAGLLRFKKKKCIHNAEERELVSSEGIDASWRDLKDREKGCIVPYRDRGWLKECVERGLSQREIVDICDVNVSRRTIRKWINRFGIERPDSEGD